jgi:hypothetical protein
MNQAFEMGLGTMIHIPSFIKTGSANQTLIGGNTHIDTQTRTDTQAARCSHKPTIIFQIMEIG